MENPIETCSCKDCKDWAQHNPEGLTKIKVEMTEPSYYCTIFTIMDIDSPHNIQCPRIGELCTASNILAFVFNGCEVTIIPPPPKSK